MVRDSYTRVGNKVWIPQDPHKKLDGAVHSSVLALGSWRQKDLLGLWMDEPQNVESD